MTKMKLNRKPTKAGNGSTYSNQFGMNGISLQETVYPSVPIIILPCDPIALVERLDILMTSKTAENTGVRNELVSVCH